MIPGETIVNQPNSENETNLDVELWDRVLRDDPIAFEAVVERHQGAVSAVAYCIVGDHSLGQDVAQETFWAAWRCRHELREKQKLASWLCGIARNLARQALIKPTRERSLEDIAQWDVCSNESDPSLASVTREENELVWKSLESIPEHYREAIAIYYRQGESIASMAVALEISVDAAKQRLSRGREMLRAQLASLVEDVLHRSTPSRQFTARVMLGVAAWTTVSKATSAASAASVGSAAGMATTLGSGAALGFLGGLTSILIGLGGAWLGVWLPAQLAPNMSERELIEKYGKRMLFHAIVFTLGLLSASVLFFVPYGFMLYWIVWAMLMLWFGCVCIAGSRSLQRRLRELQKLPISDLEPNPSPLRNRLAGQQWIGKRYTSKWRFLGLPLIDIQFADIRFDALHSNSEPKIKALGWIAIGDSATGVLIAIGGAARGLIAFGGIALGGFAFGGLSIGLLSVGGGAMGVVACGGGSIGYDSIGGASLGWHSATGGGAIAYHAAAGGFAMARDFAFGGAAIARDANSVEAKAYVQKVSMFWLMEWYLKNQTLGTLLMISPAILLSTAGARMYRKTENNSLNKLQQGSPEGSIGDLK